MWSVIVFSLLYALSAYGVYMIKLGTYAPTEHGGNGNPTLVFIIPTTILFVLTSVFLIRKLIKLFSSLSRSKLLIYITITTCLLFAFGYMEWRWLKEISQKLNEANIQVSLTINQYTNTVYFNAYTFIIGILSSFLISLIWTLIKQRESKVQCNY